MRRDTITEIQQRIATTRDNRMRVRKLVDAGKGDLAEPDRTRDTAYVARIAKSLGTPESIMQTNDFQPAVFLADGATARRAVARVLVQTPTESRSGSGFLISGDLFITNQHVINGADDARTTNIYFDDELDHSGHPAARTVFSLAPDKLALFSDESDLDYAIVAVGEKVDGPANLAALGACPLNFAPDRHRIGMNANIVQHPNGLPKTIAVRNNLLTDRTDKTLLYETDTDVGSSGAPVLNDQWDVIALHHYGEVEASVEKANTSVNEGIRISAIYEDLQKRAEALDPISKEIVQRALALWTDSSASAKRLELRPAAPQTGVDLAQQPASTPASESAMQPNPSGSFVMTVPLEISLRFPQIVPGGVAPVSAEAAAAVAAPPAKKKLVQRTEATRLDTDYSNRNGFDAAFIAGVKVDLEKICAADNASIAPLKSNKTFGRLDYQNFSLVMQKSRRFALVTATNIDGPSYVKIIRATGQPAQSADEADTWYKDSRIDDALTIGTDFYSGWGHLFDKGHLTRREDPNWGKNAVRANADTFHFTNCTPQHWLFNESMQYWQGLEQYVLEKGLVATGSDNRLTVLQGPVFDDANDLWADDVQVPSAFWKIVVWKGKGGLKAVALIADQTQLLSIERGGADAKISKKFSDSIVSQYQSSVATIEKKTGLDLSAIRPFDTAGQPLPTVGEAFILITQWADIKL